MARTLPTIEHSCAHAHAHARRAPAALAAAEEACERRGLRLTVLRHAILERLYETHRPLGAYDLIESLAAAGGKRMAPISVYRALDFLVENGFVHRLASRNAFLACPFGHAPGEMVVFMICETCGGVDEPDAAETREALARLARREKFRLAAPIIELTGQCEHCVGAVGSVGA